ncbi:MAG: hypothetical protein PHD67_09860 [Oscillospiraceae bacterium]|nr:hypothetical protein [Oscillospiraceae bacterium]
MKDAFRTAQGVLIPSIEGVEEGYRAEEVQGETELTLSLSITRQEEFLRRFCRGLAEPAYFTLETPAQKDGELLEGDGQGYDVYYLDGCTRPVLDALLDRYAALLLSDGLVRFGFASHEGQDEVFVSDYKVLQVRTALPGRTEAILREMGIPRRDALVTLWDVVTRENPAELSLVEAQEEWIFDIPGNLQEAGMYFAQHRDE